MKSILQEENSVIKAVEKAWDISGRPSEFSVKILNFEEKNFFGIIKKPAVVSISYNPEKTVGVPKKIEFQNKNKAIIAKVNQNRVENIKSGQEKVDIDFSKRHIVWKDEYVDHVKSSFKDILAIMQFNVDFSITVENKMLNIFLDKRILKDNEDEKMFFISISNLLMQFLRRKYKKKFSNYYLIIHSKNNKNE
ncbi:hypothetical protein KJ644_00010 [Candidatus Dependentiae bacterium]|nr:hypothetical protein [Candidatus Dependentiae bacterium]MBU4386843.1 hypothetical protein [Candidatus Dependentiae bacterium]MCG2756313.1 hypothetical protein [Candidatus Dependentiae bacterium]